MEGSLKLDQVKVNLELAEEYIKKNEEILEDLTFREDSDTVASNSTSAVSTIIQELLYDHRERLLQLAEKVQQNSRLFGELEYMRRGIHPETVINTDLKLLVQKLQYCASVSSDAQRIMKITREEPLAQLGFYVCGSGTLAGCAVYSHESVWVVLLFMQLCREVGIAWNPILNSRPSEEEKIPSGCMGIITEHADLDSALDVFVDSSSKYPWSMKRLLVQESIYDRLQTALDFKCKLKNTTCMFFSDINSFRFDYIQNKCAKEFSFYDKVFLLEFFGDKSMTDSHYIILVEAYRTTKELLALANDINLPYVSLWSNDISEANEIAYKTNAQAIWINDYAQFNGPPEISGIYYNLKAKKEKPKVLEDWLKLTQDTRTSKIRECLVTFAETENISEHEDLRGFLNKVLINLMSQSFQKASFTNGSLCVVDHKPVGILGVNTSDLDRIVEAIACLKTGSGIRYTTGEHPIKKPTVNIVNLFKILEENHLPVFEDSDTCTISPWDYETKAVWTTFGTIFAN